jgi:hypothetical protein
MQIGKGIEREKQEESHGNKIGRRNGKKASVKRLF